jgi:Fe-S cluster assembly protein SufD
MTTIAEHSTSLTSILLEAYKGLKHALPATALRNEGAALLEEKGLPIKKEEEYKFTPITKIIESKISRFSHAHPSVNLDKRSVAENLIPDLDCHLLVLNNGKLDKRLSSFDSSLLSVTSFVDLPEGKIEKQVGKIAQANKDPFVALNQLAFQEGIWLEVGAKTVLEKPVLILQFVQASQEGETVHSRSYIQVGKNAAATFIEKVISLDESSYFLNGVTEINVGENSQVDFYRVQDESKAALEVNNTDVNVPRDATFSSAVISLQAMMIRNNLSINLMDSNSLGNMYGLYLLNGQTHVDNHTNVDHTKSHAESNELYKGILADHSRGVFNGKIFVRQDAQKTNAFQQNNNILLSEDAVINTKPQLEIWADDVKCSHGCTTGQLDEEALFYLRSRGVSKEIGRGMLLYAFAGEVLEKINNETFRDYCVGLVKQRLGSHYS